MSIFGSGFHPVSITNHGNFGNLGWRLVAALLRCALSSFRKNPYFRCERRDSVLREFSAGALVLRHMQEQWWVAVIEPGRHGEPEDRKNVIALPKGNVDPGEKPEQTALREVMEETGVRAKPITKLDSIKYVYARKWSDGQKIFKVVTFYL